MKISSLVLFAAFLIIGISSLMLLSIAYVCIVFKNRKLDAILYFWEYASSREMFLIKAGSIGLVITGILFILF